MTITVDVNELIEGHPTACSWEDFLAHRSDRSRLFTIDIVGSDTVSLNNLLSAIDMSPLIVERCLDPDTVSGVHVYDELLAVQLPVAENWQASSHPKLSILCFSNALITICTDGQTKNIIDRLKLYAPPVSRSVDTVGLLFALLDNIVDRASELTLQARVTVDRLEVDMRQLVNEDNVGHRIFDLKQAVAHFEMALEAKHRTLMVLLSIDTDLIDLHRIREQLHDVVAHVEHSLRYIERTEDYLAALNQHFLLLLQDRTNNRLRVLTIISAIFMPLTLIAGVYGMNFHVMPELSWHYGYWGILLIMLSITLGLLWYFYRKDWFR